MLYRERIALCSQIHTKHINTLCGQNVELSNVKLAVNILTSGLWSVDITVVSFDSCKELTACPMLCECAICHMSARSCPPLHVSADRQPVPGGNWKTNIRTQIKMAKPFGQDDWRKLLKQILQYTPKGYRDGGKPWKIWNVCVKSEQA